MAVFTIKIKLTEQEIEAYRANAESIKYLAYSISDRPSEFLVRRV